MPTGRNDSSETKSPPIIQPYDPRTKRGPPQRLEDTNAAGDALNDTGEDNQRCKEED
jgi:hypothetical protein